MAALVPVVVVVVFLAAGVCSSEKYGLGPPLGNPGDEHVLAPEISKQIPTLLALSTAVMVFNDKQAELTVIRDQKYGVCFLTMLRPRWYYPTPGNTADVLAITPAKKLPFEVGPFIQDLCNRDRSYWVDKAPRPAPQPVPIFDDKYIDDFSHLLPGEVEKPLPKDAIPPKPKIPTPRPHHPFPTPRSPYKAPTPKPPSPHPHPTPKPPVPHPTPKLRTPKPFAYPTPSPAPYPAPVPRPKQPYAVPTPHAPKGQTGVPYKVPAKRDPEYPVPEVVVAPEKPRSTRRRRQVNRDDPDIADYFVYTVGYQKIMIPKKDALFTPPIDLYQD